MLARWPIRFKLLFGIAVLCLIVAILSFSSFRGVYAYRQVSRSISCRAIELPLTAKLAAEVSKLRSTLRQVRTIAHFPGAEHSDPGFVREEFQMRLLDIGQALDSYHDALEHSDLADPFIGDKRSERESVAEVERSLLQIAQLEKNHDWVLDPVYTDALDLEVEKLSHLARELPIHLQKRMQMFRDEVRGQYRTWIVLTWTASILAAIFIGLLVFVFYVWIFMPLNILVAGSRRVAGGDFRHRIRLNTHDEVAELAESMNAMTERFQQIRDDLDEQVKQRTREVVRSEQLASVGFLAAGVAHEINNPMASIAWCAESLESRMYEILHQGPTTAQSEELEENEEPEENEEVEVLRRYLRRIQDEAFRCKGITDRLLDFSRIGDVNHQRTDLRELVQSVIDMVKHLGKYREKHLEFQCDQYIAADANAQEIKQVVLNLITNGLDSLDVGGTVQIQLQRVGEEALLVVEDDGCGMSEDVLQHLFEPFFTRRRHGQGTGLGLSIVYRIVTDHGGRIEAASDGPGSGSRIKVTLPLRYHEQEAGRENEAA